MEHKLFKPQSFEESQHGVVGHCNGIPMEKRWEIETPLFARAILDYADKAKGKNILDYGCGCGRLAKQILEYDDSAEVVGCDNSDHMLAQAKGYIDKPNFKTCQPDKLHIFKKKFDVIYCVYVLQHIPAIEIRTALSRMHHYLKKGGYFIYCSAEYRMAVRYDNPQFFDDRFLGVNLVKEVEKFFDIQSNLFSDETFKMSPILDQILNGDLKHPAIVGKKKKMGNYFDDISPKREPNASPDAPKTDPVSPHQEIKPKANPNTGQKKKDASKLLLMNRLSPGDCLVMTNAIRDLDLAYPGQYLIDTRTPCNQLYENNPRITKLNYDENLYQQFNSECVKKDAGKMSQGDRTKLNGDVLMVDMHYPVIHKSGELGHHFSQGHSLFLSKMLEKEIPQTSLRPELFLSQDERDWPSPVTIEYGTRKPYWIINAGTKGDFTLKQYPYYQQVVNTIKHVHDIDIVQIGVKSHNHKPLDGVIDMVGKTDIRQLIRTTYHAEGIITCVSLPMHIAASLKTPCVVVAGAREGTRWELYPNHQFLYVNGCLPCASYDGCWQSKHKDCLNLRDNVPLCMKLIKPDDIVRAVLRYYEGGILVYPENMAVLTKGGA